MADKDSDTKIQDKVGANPPQPDDVTEDIGGVQGSEASETSLESSSNAIAPGRPEKQPAPDGGEIEWAGQVVKTPPTPNA